MTRREYLRDLAGRLMRVPVMYGTDQGDVDLLNAIAADMGPEGEDELYPEEAVEAEDLF